MNKRFIGTVIAVLVLAGLAGYVFMRQPTDATDAERSTRTIFDRDAETIRTIQVSNKNGTFRFERGEDSSWRLIGDSALPVAQRRLNEMRSALSRLTAVAVVWVEATGENRKEVGLGSGATRVTFWTDKNKDYTLEIGNLHPRGEEYYVARADRPTIYSVRKWTIEVFQKDLPDYRRRQILSLAREKADGLRIQRGGETTLEFARNAAWWRMTHPIADAPADADVVGTMIGKLANLRAEEFIADNVTDFAPYGLDKPEWTTVITVGKATHKIEFGRSIESPDGPQAFPSYFVRSADVASVYSTSSPLRNDFRRDAKQWRDENVLPFDPGEAALVEVEIAGTTTTARKGKDESWRTAGDVSRYANPQVMGLLRTVRDLQAAAFVDDTPRSLSAYGLDKPATRLTITLMDGRELELLVGSSRGRLQYVKTNLFPGVYAAPADPIVSKVRALQELTADEVESDPS